ncbi:hypothetical protein HPB49_004551 [Dermacentor silvarum]|uniref:Uncharacterized protein n=1 Tax=Dermacentor silvarum TaxID=543639 RepID=A0ACB8DAK3_DERSI|nr:hypothetical protein HPB49_004551 [Dermacentor silvarum]
MPPIVSCLAGEALVASLKKLRGQDSPLEPASSTPSFGKVAEVKARWKNLRDTFRRVLKDRARASKSGAPADDALDESTKWVFFSRLMFLKDTMEGRPTSGNLEPQSQMEESLCDVETAQEILEGIYMEKEVSTSESTEPLEALPAESCGDVSVQPPPPKKKNKNKKN